MASLKIVLRTSSKKKDGTCPLAIRITKDRKSRFIFTGYYISESYWDKDLSRVKRSHPNSSRLNNFLLKKLSEANDMLIETESKKEFASIESLQTKIRGKNTTCSFFELGARRVTGKFEEGTYSVAKAELSILYNIREFATFKKSQSKEVYTKLLKKNRQNRMLEGRKARFDFVKNVNNEFGSDKSLAFEQIDIGFINRFKTFCKSYLDQSTRTVTNQLIFIRTLYNQAIKEGLTKGEHYPFADDKEKIRIKSGQKIGLTSTELGHIENLELEEGTSIWHTRNVWLFAFYFAGIRISDVIELRHSDFMDGRLYYTMNKNEKPVSLKVPSKAKAILDLYASKSFESGSYVFPFLNKANENNHYDHYVKVKNASRLFNDYLKRIAKLCNIDKPLSNHIARHTFGNIVGDRINPLMLQKLYRHSDLKTTIGYQSNFIHKDADDALDAVVGH